MSEDVLALVLGGLLGTVAFAAFAAYHSWAWRRETIRHREAMRRWRPVIANKYGEIIWRYGASSETEEKARDTAASLQWLLRPGETLDVEHMTPEQTDAELRQIRKGR